MEGEDWPCQWGSECSRPDDYLWELNYEAAERQLEHWNEWHRED